MSEYKLSYTAKDIDTKLGQIEEIVKYGEDGGFGYTKDTNITILEPQTHNFTKYSYDENDGVNEYFIYVSPNNLDTSALLVEGNAIVVWDGKEYNCRIRHLDDNSVNIGNGQFDNSHVDTGEPFEFMVSPTGATIEVITRNEGNHTFELYFISEVAHAINEKYLPKNGVGYDLSPYEGNVLKLQEREFVNPRESGYYIDLSPLEIDMSLAYQGLRYNEFFKIIWDGEIYIRNGFEFDSSPGSFDFFLGDDYNTYQGKFAFTFSPSGASVWSKTGGVHSFSITRLENEVKKIDTKYLPEGLCGYTEDYEYITWDGNTNNKIEYYGSFVQILDRPVDLSRVKSCLLENRSTEQITRYDSDSLETRELPSNIQALTFNGIPVVVSCPRSCMTIQFGGSINLKRGTYFCNDYYGFNCRGISLGEKIHKIDTKYLPEKLIINISDLGLDMSMFFSGYPLPYGDATAEDIDNLMIPAVNNMDPIFITSRVDGQDYIFTFYCTLKDDPYYYEFYCKHPLGDYKVAVDIINQTLTGNKI